MSEIKEFSYEIILIDHGTDKVGVIRWIRNNTGLSLAEAKSLVENLPQTIVRATEPYGFVEAEMKARAAIINKIKALE